MKRLIIILLIISMTAAFCACGGKDTEDTSSGDGMEGATSDAAAGGEEDAAIQDADEEDSAEGDLSLSDALSGEGGI